MDWSELSLKPYHIFWKPEMVTHNDGYYIVQMSLYSARSGHSDSSDTQDRAPPNKALVFLSISFGKSDHDTDQENTSQYLQDIRRFVRIKNIEKKSCQGK